MLTKTDGEDNFHVLNKYEKLELLNRCKLFKLLLYTTKLNDITTTACDLR